MPVTISAVYVYLYSIWRKAVESKKFGKQINLHFHNVSSVLTHRLED